METNSKAYMVLSVKQLRRLLKNATTEMKAAGKKPTHCIVLDLRLVKDSRDAIQANIKLDCKYNI